MTRWSDFVYIHPSSYPKMPLRDRAQVSREMIEAGTFPDLRAAVTGMRRRAHYENLHLDREAYRHHRDLKNQRHWWWLRAQVPPGPCTYCGAPDARHIDHVISVARGGDRWDLANLVRACNHCNPQKGKRTVEEWKQWRLDRGLTWPPAWGKPNGGGIARVSASGNIYYVPFRPGKKASASRKETAS